MPKAALSFPLLAILALGGCVASAPASNPSARRFNLRRLTHRRQSRVGDLLSHLVLLILQQQRSVAPLGWEGKDLS